ncbi:TetR/AcrR family transcriptional regulator [Lysinibacter cavernae]|uniref:AcrR family transcriptional regulator n=1 Tax=Lysinibacter cavernae TaxID=1640652 RepID=A0A7X5R1X1_9MICO|nr:TetR/AcrR family transcriptional regulator [Lysinibacter cavernae]NIH54094.1 AcrR family transcriptional regulator [Lysinibacter cavernae]
MATAQRVRTHAMTEEAAAERRRDILQCASHVIAKVGVDGCSFAAVSEACGFSIGMIQHYFRTRDRLILASIDFRTSATNDEWRRISARSAHPLRSIHNLLSFAVAGEESFEDAWGFWVQVYAAAHKNEDVRVTVAASLATWRTIFVDSLREADESGLVPAEVDYEYLASLLVAVVDGLAVQTLNGLYGTSPAIMTSTLHRFAAQQLGINWDDVLSDNNTSPASAG